MIRYHGNAVAHGTNEFGSACLVVGMLLCACICRRVDLLDEQMKRNATNPCVDEGALVSMIASQEEAITELTDRLRQRDRIMVEVIAEVNKVLLVAFDKMQAVRTQRK